MNKRKLNNDIKILKKIEKKEDKTLLIPHEEEGFYKITFEEGELDIRIDDRPISLINNGKKFSIIFDYIKDLEQRIELLENKK